MVFSLFWYSTVPICSMISVPSKVHNLVGQIRSHLFLNCDRQILGFGQIAYRIELLLRS